MSDSQKPEVKKKPYTKPQLTEVRLVAQEAVLGDCKNSAGGDCEPDLTCDYSPRS